MSKKSQKIYQFGSNMAGYMPDEPWRKALWGEAQEGMLDTLRDLEGELKEEHDVVVDSLLIPYLRPALLEDRLEKARVARDHVKRLEVAIDELSSARDQDWGIIIKGRYYGIEDTGQIYIEPDWDGWVCPGCEIALFMPEGDEHTELFGDEEAKRQMRRSEGAANALYGEFKIVGPVDDETFTNDDEGAYAEFSTSECDCCGSSLGGSRRRVFGYKG